MAGVDLQALTDSCLHSSIPLVIPDDMQYDFQSNTVRKLPDVPRQNLKIVDEAIQVLCNIQKPVAALSVAGPYRSGKSYILSRLLGAQDVFQLGHTMNAKTFGIWMSTKVIDCNDYVIVLLDTEGIDAACSSESGDASILVLTILLSSYFIYNSMSVPRKQDLDKMSMFLQLASSISITDKGDNDVNELHSYFPDFLWLLRDVHLLPANEQGESITPTEYLKSKVLIRSRGFFESQADTVARAIVTFFPSIECRILPPPSTSPEIMRDIVNKADQLSPEFNSAVEDLLAHIKSSIKPKKGYSRGSVNGPIMASLVKEYVKAINSPGAIPTISNAWDTTVALYQQEIFQKLLKEYEVELDSKITEAGGYPLEVENVNAENETVTLMGLHNQVLLKKVSELIQMSSMFAQCGEEENLIKAFENIVVAYEMNPVCIEGKTWHKNKVNGGALYPFTIKNMQKSMEFCKNSINELYKPIQDKINSVSSDYTFQDLLMDLANMQSNYFDQAKGPAKWEVYEYKKKDIESDKQKFTSLKNYEDNMQKTAEEAEKAREENVRMAEEINALRSQVIRENEKHKKTLQEIQESHQVVMKQMENDREEHQKQEEEKYREFQKAQMEEMAKISQQSQQAQEMQEKALLEMMTKQQEIYSETIEGLVQNIQSAPPPQNVEQTKMQTQLPVEKCVLL